MLVFKREGFVKIGARGAFPNAQRVKKDLGFHPKSQGLIFFQAGL